MPVSLEITSGAATGRRIVIDAGQTIRVGRSAPAEIVIEGDTFLSGAHFSVHNDGSTVRLEDLRSTNGLFLNGARVHDAALRSGDEIAAGSNRFLVKLETSSQGDASAAAIPAPIPAPVPVMTDADPVLSPSEQAVLEFLKARAPLFALLDAAVNPWVLTHLRAQQSNFACLYEDKKAEELADVAPYLAALPSDSKLLPRLIHQGWPANWGVYLTSAQSLDALCQHFRRFVMVERDGKKVYFRFYDPRVMREFLPRFKPEQAADFFGPVQEFVSPAQDPDIALRFLFVDRGVIREQELLTGK